jgi:hypothetical protein
MVQLRSGKECPGLQCRNCGDVVDPRRVELGYDYCRKEECQRQCLQRVRLAAVGVNKAADYYQRADEVLPPAPPRVVPPPDQDGAGADSRASRPARRTDGRPLSTLERLRAQEKALDDALARSYERFRHGEITASEMNHERDHLIESFNGQVRGENIRYRSLVRRRPHGKD